MKIFKYIRGSFYSTCKKIIAKSIFRIEYTQKEKGKLSAIGISNGIENVQFEGNNGINYGSEFFGDIKVGYATTLGFNNTFHGKITIGRYCQFAANVAIHTGNHPTNTLTTYMNSRLFNGELLEFEVKNEVIIKNDVWIGHGVTILSGVTIEDGVIIAAGSVVNKDVPAYSVVGGVPARFIRKRFSDEMIEEVKALKWWDKNEEELEQIKDLFFKDLSKCESLKGEEK